MGITGTAWGRAIVLATSKFFMAPIFSFPLRNGEKRGKEKRESDENAPYRMAPLFSFPLRNGERWAKGEKRE